MKLQYNLHNSHQKYGDYFLADDFSQDYRQREVMSAGNFSLGKLRYLFGEYFFHITGFR
ncbi:hypothetical protein VB620_09115 [Nodularia harveyana UHCC-0300]|uniref:Uncharacterized protein n=1 Tax=Nodularia harveyana UHCC-0300 TaxID=2974287 RepID=A0ABU5UDA1_9CYAN|nr:hypothetical protein [Nodularia harveyana]MEA5581498.1 hypothetical protein [Nodularia harveyana UHCC-0300]